VSVPFILGCLRGEKPRSIEKLGQHLYRAVIRNSTFIGVGFDWHTAPGEKPFENLTVEAFLAISVLRHEMAHHLEMKFKQVNGYIPTRISATSYGIRTDDYELYVGFLMDWKHQLTEEPVTDPGLQAGLSYFLLGWLAHFKEWEYAAKVKRDFYSEELGVPAMAIDAVVRDCLVNPDGSGELHLVPRGEAAAGQTTLTFESAPDGVERLTGREIWGGAGFLMLGGVEIAQRLGYVPIRFHSQETFERAIRE
jgi:hypothetical protein